MSEFEQRTPFSVNGSVFDEDNVSVSPNGNTISWITGKRKCRIQTTEPGVAKQIRSWSFAKLVGENMNGPDRIFAMPRTKWKLALKMLNMPLPPKNPNRVRSGKNAGSRNLK